MLSLQGEAEDHGAAVAFVSPVTGGRAGNGPSPSRSAANSRWRWRAAPSSTAPASAPRRWPGPSRAFRRETVPALHYAKGNYFYLTGRAPFERLIYPVPGTAGLGLHYTRDLGGQGRFGPDVEWVDAIDYRVDPLRAETFYTAIRRYWPALPDNALTPGYSGVRPKLQAPGEAAADFVFQGPETHGIDGLINLFGIESPGLTASLAIADAVTERFGLGRPAA